MNTAISSRLPASAGTMAVLFDGRCELCEAAIAAFGGFDGAGGIERLDANDPIARARFPELSAPDLAEQIHVVDDEGTVYRGARASVEILRRRCRAGTLAASFWYFPGVPALANAGYRAVAASRHRPGIAARLAISIARRLTRGPAGFPEAPEDRRQSLDGAPRIG